VRIPRRGLAVRRLGIGLRVSPCTCRGHDVHIGNSQRCGIAPAVTCLCSTAVTARSSPSSSATRTSSTAFRCVSCVDALGTWCVSRCVPSACVC
jgi:hypothetical protein